MEFESTSSREALQRLRIGMTEKMPVLFKVDFVRIIRDSPRIQFSEWLHCATSLTLFESFVDRRKERRNNNSLSNAQKIACPTLNFYLHEYAHRILFHDISQDKILYNSIDQIEYQLYGLTQIEEKF